jgi:hypothetical protein
MRSLSEEENQKEEWAIIQAGFNDLEKRTKLLPKLKKIGFEEEALLLCCCYIEAMGNLYFRKEGNQHNFYYILKKFGGEEPLIYIHPKQLWIGLISTKNLRGIGEKIGITLKGAKKKLYTEEQALTLVANLLNKKEMTKLRSNLWRGTLAVLAYEWFRNPAVHELGGAKSFSFEGTTFKGKPAPVLDFSLLYRGMLNILRNMSEISAKTKTYFGQDFDSILNEYLAIHREWEKLGSDKEAR